MNKDEFLKRYAPSAFHEFSWHKEFTSDLNTLLAGKAEKQRKACAEYYKSNCKDFDGYVYEVILHTPLNDYEQRKEGQE